jgi:hypothetical protein
MFAKPLVQEVPLPVSGNGGQHAEILRNFADAILTGEPLIAPAEEGIHSVELANAMLFSSFLNRPVEFPMDGVAYEQKLMELIQTSKFNKTTSDSIAADLDQSFNTGSS